MVFSALYIGDVYLNMPLGLLCFFFDLLMKKISIMYSASMKSGELPTIFFITSFTMIENPLLLCFSLLKIIIT